MASWALTDIVDAVLAPCAILLLLAYHVFLCYKVRSSPLQTVMGINRRARRIWVHDMQRENHKKNVLAVQTLRNSIMESTLMATTAVLLTAGLATYFSFASTLKEMPGMKNSKAIIGVTTSVKSFAVLTCLMISFLCHTQSIRFINHVNYMVNLPMDDNNTDNAYRHHLTADYVADLLERGTILYTIGSRTFYLAFPLLLWVFGSIAMFVSSIVLVHALYNSDFVTQLETPISPKQANNDVELQLSK